ncbi:MAG: recombinase family protein [Chloroflexota bacterium]|nr:recombinase family protein [Chloroflexota bacterium]
MRAALYARVSSEEQVKGYSLDAQRRAFRTLAQQRGWTIYREYVEEGRSAHKEDVRKRPVFMEAIHDALANAYDVLVVHKIDRFARRRRVTDEYFEKLSKAGVGFLSIMEQMDFTTPMGKFALGMFGGMAQLYSDNLGEETKKGWHERRDQGYYCGLLPFGAMKGDDGLPTPDPATYPGLKLAFEESAKGKPDGEIARLLNQKGYRTAGNQGNRPFGKDTVRGLLINRFYVGEIPFRENGKVVRWIKAKHQPFLAQDLFERVQDERQRNRRMCKQHPRQSRPTALTGIAKCWYCGGKYHVGATKGGKQRLMCYNRAQRLADCPARSALLERYEVQLQAYLVNFHIPEDYQTRILARQKDIAVKQDEISKERARLNQQLERIKKLFQWGDYDEDQYFQEKHGLERQLRELEPSAEYAAVLQRLAEYLSQVPEAWKGATGDQRNRLLRRLFEEVWIKDDQIVALRPRAEMEPFFKLSFEEWVTQHGGFEVEAPKPFRVASNQE